MNDRHDFRADVPPAGAAVDRSRAAPTPLLVDTKTAAAMLGISARKLWELTNCGAVPAQRIGRSVRYSPALLQAWVDAGCPTEPGAAETLGRRR